MAAKEAERPTAIVRAFPKVPGMIHPAVACGVGSSDIAPTICHLHDAP
jgi:hypothetical protein